MTESRPIDPPASFVFPDYDGGSLANVPATVGALLGADAPWRSPPLRDADPSRRRRKVVTLLLDGMGWNRWQRALADDRFGAAAFWRQGDALRLTSVCPSTTSVATTVLTGDGSAPAELGTLGYTLRLAETGLLANLLFFRPEGEAGAAPGALERWGVHPENFLSSPSIFQLLGEREIDTAAILPASIAGGPLSRMQLRGAEVLRSLDFVDALAQLGDWLARTERGYAYLYHPPLDGLSHRDGPDTELWDATFASITDDLVRWLGTLPPEARRDTDLLVLADHGHAATPPVARRALADLPDFDRRVALHPGGELRNRLLYLRPDPAGDPVAATLDAVRATLAEDAWGVATADALAAGLYGPPERAHPDALARLGDVALLARGGAGLRAPGDHESMRGMHGSLEPDEMWVPLIRFALDAI